MIEVSEKLDAAAFGKAVAAAPLLDGRYVVRTQKVTALDSDDPPVRFVVIAFDTEDKFKAWRDSPRNQGSQCDAAKNDEVARVHG